MQCPKVYRSRLLHIPAAGAERSHLRLAIAAGAPWLISDATLKQLRRDHVSGLVLIKAILICTEQLKQAELIYRVVTESHFSKIKHAVHTTHV